MLFSEAKRINKFSKDSNIRIKNYHLLYGGKGGGSYNLIGIVNGVKDKV